MTQAAPAFELPAFPTTDEVFGEGGLLARHFPGYAPRPGQIEMTCAVDDAYANKKRLLVEAGTGVGKSIGYLVPAIRAYATEATRTLVVTSNIALQEQLTRKDLPALVRTLRRPFRFALLKGTSNYLCREALDESMLDPGSPLEVRDVAGWAQRTATGDLSELDRELPPRARAACTTSAEDCLGSKCPSAERCFVLRARLDARQAHVVVVNYHLFFADLSIRADGGEGILPSHGAVVLDEVHNAADIARSFFGRRISHGSVMHVSRRLLSIKAELAKELERASDRFFADLDAYRRSKDYRARLEQATPVDHTGLHHALRAAAKFLRDAMVGETDELALKRLEAVANNADRQAAFLLAAMKLEGSENVVYSIDESEGKKSAALVGQPIDVGPMLREHLWESPRLGTVVGTSATLGDGKSFDLVASEVGAEGVRQLVVPSPFDWPRNALVVVPPGLPLAGSAEWGPRMCSALVDAVWAAGGRTLGLFTSRRMLREAALACRAVGFPWPVLVQGEAPRTKLVEQFRQDVRSVLLGTSSLWEGVDVQGESLSCVVMDKLPFGSPDDPIASVLEERRGRRYFKEVAVPRAVLDFRQGAGRLIRTATDRGVIVLLDDRILTKPYGRAFLRGLPEGVPVERGPHWAERVKDFLEGAPF
jgi:ATP-dependent DNA helicase DinG